MSRSLDGGTGPVPVLVPQVLRSVGGSGSLLKFYEVLGGLRSSLQVPSSRSSSEGKLFPALVSDLRF